MTKQLEIINKNIIKSKTLRNSKIYVIDSEVHVKSGVKLTIEDNTTILITNGAKNNTLLRRSALIFDQGSELRAQRLNVKAANDKFQAVRHADNGGLWFIGNTLDASKDRMSTRVNRKKPLSNFCARTISTYYLGRHDDYLSKKSGRIVGIGDDIDGLSLLGIGRNEWGVDNIKTFYSGDDGFDITNSHISLKTIEVIAPTEDGLNLSSSRVEVHKSLKVDVTRNGATDRDIFDFEADDGSSFLEIYQNCNIDIKGILGDQITLSSKDMPPLKRRKTLKYKGKARRAATLVYTIGKD
jgi:hypothetical protein